jgi:hypothetical protein
LGVPSGFDPDPAAYETAGDSHIQNIKKEAPHPGDQMGRPVSSGTSLLREEMAVNMVLRAGIELATFSLQRSCSTY